MTEVVRVAPAQPRPADIARAAACLRRGGLVAFPTETVYGLGVHALDRDAVRRLFDAKGRPANDPLIVHIASLDQLPAVVAAVPPAARELAARFWPGPLTLVLPRADAVPLEVTAGLGTVAVRVPAHPVAHALLEAAGVPVAAPSANLFSRPSPTQAAHVLHDLGGRIDMVLDAGATPLGVESTVVDLTGEVPIVLRPGAVTLEDLRTVLPDVRLRPEGTQAPADGGAMASPGLLAKHYAPRAPLTLFRGDAAAARAAIDAAAHEAAARGERVGLLLTSDDARTLRGLPAVVAELGPADDIAAVAGRLYAALRELDSAGADLILARDLEQHEGLGRAVRDRLLRAAASVVVV
jgi:L-threonylcarbamoyladenylate synthase